MREVKLLLGALTLLGSGLAYADGETLEARSIADSCRFVYRIETDVRLSAPGKDAVMVWLKDLYTETLLEPEVVELTDGRAAFTQVTMSQNPKYLAHELYLAPFATDSEPRPEKPTWVTNFSGLMQRCYEPREREIVAFQPLTLMPFP